jgi:hypothetical protein
MRDSLTVDEASFYFQDPAFEDPHRPRLFPMVSTTATVDVSSLSKNLELTLPRNTASVFHFASLSPMSTGSDVVPSSRTQKPSHKPQEFWHDFVADDDSSCRTLDYSLDSDSEGDFVDSRYHEESIVQFDLNGAHHKEVNKCFELPVRWIISWIATFGR